MQSSLKQFASNFRSLFSRPHSTYLNSTMQRFARVITDDLADKELEYAIPDDWASKIEVGSRVRVPLRSRDLLATVVAVSDQAVVEAARPITAVVSPRPVLSPALLE